MFKVFFEFIEFAAFNPVRILLVKPDAKGCEHFVRRAFPELRRRPMQ